MRCDKCGGRGWVESWRRESNAFTPSIEQCFRRCNLTGYSNEVQRRLNSKEPTERKVYMAPPAERPLAQVLPFRPREKVAT